MLLQKITFLIVRSSRLHNFFFSSHDFILSVGIEHVAGVFMLVLEHGHHRRRTILYVYEVVFVYRLCRVPTDA